jgi:hypothetical protein
MTKKINKSILVEINKQITYKSEYDIRINLQLCDVNANIHYCNITYSNESNDSNIVKLNDIII